MKQNHKPENKEQRTNHRNERYQSQKQFTYKEQEQRTNTGEE